MGVLGNNRLNWQQVCGILHCSRGTFYRLLEAGTLQWHAEGMARWIELDDVKAYIKKKNKLNITDASYPTEIPAKTAKKKKENKPETAKIFEEK